MADKEFYLLTEVTDFLQCSEKELKKYMKKYGVNWVRMGRKMFIYRKSFVESIFERKVRKYDDKKILESDIAAKMMQI